MCMHLYLARCVFADLSDEYSADCKVPFPTREDARQRIRKREREAQLFVECVRGLLFSAGESSARNHVLSP